MEKIKTASTIKHSIKKYNHPSLQTMVAGLICCLLISCQSSDKSSEEYKEDEMVNSVDFALNNDVTSESIPPVEIVDTCGLRVYFPNYSKIDLVCGKMPTKDDTSVIMFAEAAFTGELLEEFNHKNISSNHVSGGEYYPGYLCKRSRGAFTYYNGKPQFVYQDGFQNVSWPEYLESALRTAAQEGGCGFAQEIMIHEGKKTPHTRPDSNANEFRALCLIDGKVAVADSRGTMKFGDFINNLIKAGATEAIYLDMGRGWNYSWYRDANGNPIEIHPTPTKYATNWITFYR